RDGHGQAGNHRGNDASPHPAHQIRAPGAVQIDKYDADNQGGFDTFTQCDEESREQNAVLKRSLPETRFASMNRPRGHKRSCPAVATVSRKVQARAKNGPEEGAL